ncbi:AP2-like ethylene-responsive transcription factor At2g41710 [Camellia sinensis]|uniref:AP2-like ethylene-responsive transcription factor At2g41710 n=1 Tax=Camellia sinensis TaxID=4442 RepID=UPI0010366957|nr:AP2-like ethylene-responsive transcription factor At2g41710 [Camellia sinensis]
MAQGVCELLWIRLLLRDLGIHQTDSIRLYCDNTMAINIAHNPVQHDRTKHVEIDGHFIKEKFTSGTICTPFVRSGDQLADVLTKGLGNKPFRDILNKLGAFDEEESAARAYDLAAIKYWGPTTFTNFPVPEYEKEIEIMQNLTKEEYLASLRRRSSGFSRGVSKYRGVARHHHNGRWEARIGRVFGNKYLYLGTYSTQEEAAHAYDIAAIEYRGINAVTNFDLSTYIRWLRPGGNSVALQEPVQKLEPPLANSSTNFMSSQEPPEFTFRSSPYKLGDTGNNMPRKQELLETKMPISPCNTSASPTALGLLLRSSMFRELVEKNSNVIADDDTDNQNKAKKEPGIGGSDDLRGMFYSNIGSNPYGCSTRSETLQTQEAENTLPLYNNNKTGQSLWNVAFNLPSN